MKRKALLPTEVLVNEPVRKVVAEAADGSFCLLPRHVDFVTALVPGLLVFEREHGEEELVAVDYQSDKDLVCGIELRVGGFKLTWTVADYHRSLHESIDELLEQAAEKDESKATS